MPIDNPTGAGNHASTNAGTNADAGNIDFDAADDPDSLVADSLSPVALTPPPTGPRPSVAVHDVLDRLAEGIVNRINEAEGDAQQYFGDVKRLLRAVEIVGRVSTLDDEGDDDERDPFGFYPPRPRRRRGARPPAEGGPLVGLGNGDVIGANPMGNMVGQMVDAMAEHMPRLQGAVQRVMPPEVTSEREERSLSRQRGALLDEFSTVREMLMVPGLGDEQRSILISRAEGIMNQIRESRTPGTVQEPARLPATNNKEENDNGDINDSPRS